MQHLQIAALLLLAVTAANSYSISQNNGQVYINNGNVQVIKDSNTFKCDRINCPINETDHCIASMQSLPDNPTVVRRKNYCYSADKKLLNYFDENENVGNGIYVLSNLVVFRDGSTYTDSSPDFKADDPELRQKFDESMKQWSQDFQKNMNNFQVNLQHHMNNLQKSLSDRLSNMFKWI